MKSDMRVMVSKRMLKEGMLKCLESKPLSKITVSDLCRESGINRTTFYNHYDSPTMVINDICREYAEKIIQIYIDNLSVHNINNDDAALEACLTYILGVKSFVKVLFSKNAEHCLAGFAMEIIEEIASSNSMHMESYDEHILLASTSAATVYGFIQTWITSDIDKTPKQLVAVLKRCFRTEYAFEIIPKYAKK